MSPIREPIFSNGHGDDGEKIESSGRSEIMERIINIKTSTIDKNKKDKNEQKRYENNNNEEKTRQQGKCRK